MEVGGDGWGWRCWWGRNIEREIHHLGNEFFQLTASDFYFNSLIKGIFRLACPRSYVLTSYKDYTETLFSVTLS